MGNVDVTAPFYGLVILVDRVIAGEAHRRGEATKAARRNRELAEAATS